jgi:uncharacterized Zn finger protein
MPFESRIDQIICKVCGSEHDVRWHRIPFREPVTLRCKACGEIMLQGNTIRDYDEPVLVRRVP